MERRWAHHCSFGGVPGEGTPRLAALHPAISRHGPRFRVPVARSPVSELLAGGRSAARRSPVATRDARAGARTAQATPTPPPWPDRIRVMALGGRGECEYSPR
jgi:hypothetical protein